MLAEGNDEPFSHREDTAYQGNGRCIYAKRPHRLSSEVVYEICSSSWA